MHLTRLDINPYISSRLGLQISSMENLGSLVVLVGENGCGKTRLLEAMDWLLRRTRQVGYARLLQLRAGQEKQLNFFHALLEGGDDHLSSAGAASDLDVYNAVLSPFEGLEIACADGEDVNSALSAYCALSDILRNSITSNREHLARLTVGVPRGDDLTDPLLVGTPLIYIDDVCVRQAAALSEEPMGMHSAHSVIERDFTRLQELLNDIAGLRLEMVDKKACIEGRTVNSLRSRQYVCLCVCPNDLTIKKILNTLT